jgi:hypothetical protein
MFTGSKETLKLYRYLGFILLAVACVGLVWSFWPLPAHQQSLALSPTNLQSLNPGVQFPDFLLKESRQLVLSYPAVLRKGDTGLLTLRWDFASPPGSSPASAAGPSVLIETRLDLVGVFQNPTGSIDAPLFSGQALVLERQLTGVQDGTYSGTLWSYLNPSPASSSSSTTQAGSGFLPVAAQDIEMQIISLFGLDFFTARSMGVSCLVFAAGLLAYAFLGKPKKSRRSRLQQKIHNSK